jgi:single-stranded DNA-binding protein
MQEIILVGRLMADADLSRGFVKFTLITSKPYKENNEFKYKSTFWDIAVFDENVWGDFYKGDILCVVGTIDVKEINGKKYNNVVAKKITIANYWQYNISLSPNESKKIKIKSSFEKHSLNTQQETPF